MCAMFIGFPWLSMNQFQAINAKKHNTAVKKHISFHSMFSHQFFGPIPAITSADTWCKQAKHTMELKRFSSIMSPPWTRRWQNDRSHLVPCSSKFLLVHSISHQNCRYILQDEEPDMVWHPFLPFFVISSDVLCNGGASGCSCFVSKLPGKIGTSNHTQMVLSVLHLCLDWMRHQLGTR